MEKIPRTGDVWKGELTWFFILSTHTSGYLWVELVPKNYNPARSLLQPTLKTMHKDAFGEMIFSHNPIDEAYKELGIQYD